MRRYLPVFLILLTTLVASTFVENQAIVKETARAPERERESLGEQICCVAADPKRPKRLTQAWFQNCNVHAHKVGRPFDAAKIQHYYDFVRRSDVSPCEERWNNLLDNSLGCFWLGDHISSQFRNGSSTFDYVEDVVGWPRYLILGDSISYGTFTHMKSLYREYQVARHFAPENCLGFDHYNKRLHLWLGECPWDVIQFNVGAHFHVGKKKVNGSFVEKNKTISTYTRELLQVLNTLRVHSPRARIIFALTTPTPFDSIETTPNRTACKKYDKFAPAGYVAMLNDIARNALEPMNVTISDRYEAVRPNLVKHQNFCDIHFKETGYSILAETDFKVFREIIGK